MKTILVVDDMPIVRTPIAAMLTTAGYRAIGVGSGNEALKVLRGDGADLILLDVMMPVMDGLTLLRHIRSDPVTAGLPVIMLSGEEDRQHIVRAGQLGIQGYVLKSSFSIKDLLRRVQNQFESGTVDIAHASPHDAGAALGPAKDAIDPSTAQPRETNAIVRPGKARSGALLSRDESIARAEGALVGKTLSGSIAQVIAMAGSSTADMTDLVKLVSRDAMISARILQVANSAAFRSAKMVSTIPDAVRQIGFACVRNIAASIGIYDAMPECGNDGFNPLHCWQHSFAVAKLCERLVAGGDNTLAVKNHAYLVGLCHDLGEVLFRIAFAREYQAVIEEQARTGLSRKDVERMMLGMTHGELVVTVLHRLGLPEIVRHPIEVFHNGGSPHGPEAARLLNLLRLAERGANGALLLATNDAEMEPVTNAEFVAATGTDNTPLIDWNEFREEISTTTALLAGLSASEIKRLTSPLFPLQDSRLWIARDPSICAFDPMTAALQYMTRHVTIRAELPTADMLGKFDKIVVLACDSTVSGFSAEDIGNVRSFNPAQPPPILWLVEHSNVKAVDNQDEASPSCWRVPLSCLAEFVARS